MISPSWKKFTISALSVEEEGEEGGRGRTRDLPLPQSATPFCIIDDGPPSFAVKGTLHEPIGDNQSRNTGNVPPERSLLSLAK